MKKILIIIFFLSLTSLINAIDINEDEIMLHNTTDDCWMIFENKVYDITSEVSKHDRYLDIRSWCGKDMTEDFETKAGLGRDHKSSTYQMLNELYVGDLTSSSTNQSSTPSVSNTDEAHDYTVEISGQELKTMAIEEVATLWKIDPESLLQEVIKEFSLQGNYSISSTINEMMKEATFSPSEIKTIAENIKNNDATDTEKQALTLKNPYNFIAPTFGTIMVWICLKLLFKSKLSKSIKILKPTGYKLILNTLMAISLIPSALFGLYMVFQYSFPFLRNISFDMLWWHVEGSIIFSVLVIIHIIERLNQVFAQLRSIK